MWSLIGHGAILQLLERSLEAGRLAHSYLLVGPPHVGKMTLALQLAQAVNCTAPARPCQECSQCLRVAAGKQADIQVLGVEEGRSTAKEIGIDQVRDLQRAASLKPFEGSCRVFIVDGAERLSQEATNALLKTLEEPPPQVLLLLLTTNEEGLLPTLRSRCQRLELRPLPTAEVARALEERGVSAERAQELAVRSQGCPGVALRALQDPTWLEAEEREVAKLLDTVKGSLHDRFTRAAELADDYSRDREAGGARLRLWMEWWRGVLLVKEGATGHLPYAQQRQHIEALAREIDAAALVHTLRLIQETLDVLDQNANPRLAFEHLLLSFPSQRSLGERLDLG